MTGAAAGGGGGGGGGGGATRNVISCCRGNASVKIKGNNTRTPSQQDLEDKRNGGGGSAFALEPASRFHEAVFKHGLFSVERFYYLDTGYQFFAPTNRNPSLETP